MPFAATCLDLENIIVVLLHVVVQSLSRVQLFTTLWTVAHQTHLSFSISLRNLPGHLTPLLTDVSPAGGWEIGTNHLIRELGL